MPYQGSQGEWYDDNGNPIQPNATTAGYGLLMNDPWNIDPTQSRMANTPNDPGALYGQIGANPYGMASPTMGATPTPAGTNPYETAARQRTIGPSVQQGTVDDGPTPSTTSDPGTGSVTNWQDLQGSIFGQMPGINTPPPFQYDPFNAPAPFAPPSAQDVLYSDPGYQFRIDQGIGAMQNSAAARGVLNTGGTLQDLVKYGQQMGSQEYGNAFNRALGTYQNNYNDALNSYQTGFGSALAKYNSQYQTNYLNPYNQSFQQYQQGVNNQGQLFNQQFQTATA